jgi:hypothetical protein
VIQKPTKLGSELVRWETAGNVVESVISLFSTVQYKQIFSVLTSFRLLPVCESKYL